MWPFSREVIRPVKAQETPVPATAPTSRTERNGQSLTKDEIAFFSKGLCPDCGLTGLLEGPSGGGSQNIYCGNTQTCGSRFNECMPFGIDRITDASPHKPKPDSETPYR